MSYNHAIELIKRNNGKVESGNITISCQKPVPVRYEKAFEGHYPISKNSINRRIDEMPDGIEFEGIGFVVRGGINCSDNSYVGKVEIFVDGELIETARFPADYATRRNDVAWKYQLPKGKHKITFNWLNPRPDANIRVQDALIYSDAPAVR